MKIINTVSSVVDGSQYIFPIPRDDLGDATIKDVERSIFLMRYIRKAIEDKTMIKYEEKVAEIDK